MDTRTTLTTLTTQQQQLAALIRTAHGNRWATLNNAGQADIRDARLVLLRITRSIALRRRPQEVAHGA